MKAILFLALVTFSSKRALACSQPQNKLFIQASEISYLTRSMEIIKTLDDLGAKDIQTVTAKGTEVRIQASNGCSVLATAVYQLPVDQGLCPRLTGVKVLKASCL